MLFTTPSISNDESASALPASGGRTNPPEAGLPQADRIMM